jgi:hypothetical protein
VFATCDEGAALPTAAALIGEHVIAPRQAVLVR